MKTEKFIPKVTVEEIFKKAKSEGVEQVEIYIIEGKNVSVEVKAQEPEAFEDAVFSGYGIRVIYNNRLGFSYSTNPDEAGNVLLKAIESSRFVSSDEYLSLPEPSGFHHNIEIYDPEIENTGKDFILNAAIELEGSALSFDRRIKKTRKASVALSKVNTTVLNSLGMNASYASTAITAQIMVVAEEAGDAQSAWEFEGSRFLKDLSFKDIGQRAAKKAISLLGSRRLSPRKAAVLFDPVVASEFLSFLSSSFLADQVIKGKSMLAGRLDERVFSPLIDIIDNALLPRRLGSRPFDAEGVTSRINNLISAGRLQGYLHNTYTARRLSAKNTSSAFRHGYTDVPSVGISNLYLAPSEKTRTVPPSELMASEPGMLYVLDVMGMHTGNPVTGDFSVGVSGLWIEKGKPVFPVREVMIAGNVIELFGKVIAIGDDLRFYGNTGSPHILFRDIDISG
ncbi:MAG: TldD/PmbA family protein [Thermodesulfovibrionales bacterium]